MRIRRFFGAEVSPADDLGWHHVGHLPHLALSCAVHDRTHTPHATDGKTGARRRAGCLSPPSQPSALRTIVALSCLDLLIVHTGAHRSVLTSIRDVLLSALCTGADGGRRDTFPPPTADVAPDWLLDVCFYFQDSGGEQCVCLTPTRQSSPHNVSRCLGCV